MRTTIDLPDELLRQVKAKAALDGLKLKDLIARYVEEGLRGSPSRAATPRRQRSALPVARAATGRTLPALTNVEIQRILDQGCGSCRSTGTSLVSTASISFA